MKRVEGRCPECNTLNAAAIYTTKRRWQEAITEFVESGLTVEIVDDDAQGVSIERCPESCGGSR